MITSLSALLLGVGLWWWAPPDDPSPTIRIESNGDQIWCGDIESADGGVIRLDVEGRAKPVAISFEDVDNMRLDLECPD